MMASPESLLEEIQIALNEGLWDSEMLLSFLKSIQKLAKETP